MSHHYRLPGSHGTLFCILQSCSLNCITCRDAGVKGSGCPWVASGFKCPPTWSSPSSVVPHSHRGNSIFYYVRPSWKQCNVNKILPPVSVPASDGYGHRCSSASAEATMAAAQAARLPWQHSVYATWCAFCTAYEYLPATQQTHEPYGKWG